jgi:hypothetical protein
MAQLTYPMGWADNLTCARSWVGCTGYGSPGKLYLGWGAWLTWHACPLRVSHMGQAASLTCTLTRIEWQAHLAWTLSRMGWLAHLTCTLTWMRWLAHLCVGQLTWHALFLGWDDPFPWRRLQLLANLIICMNEIHDERLKIWLKTSYFEKTI